MKVLITGANGFLGKILVTYLKSNNEVYTLGRSNADFNCDLGKSCSLFYNQFDVVIHAAGKAHSLKSKYSGIDNFYCDNVVGTKNLLLGLTQSSIPKYFVFISSVAVYGQDFGIDIQENFPLNAVDPYGLSKIQAEIVVSDWCNKHNVVCTILRLPLIVGPNPPGNLGSMIRGIQKGFYFNIAGGKAKKSMLLAEDLANYMIGVAKIGGVFNLTDGCHPSFDELSSYVAKKIGKKKPLNIPLWLAKIVAMFGTILGNVIPLNNRKLKKITSDLTFSDSKAREVFGWNPTPVLHGFEINPINK